MKLIEQNPFRILGIAVNAGAKELAANMGKKRLLDIGREISFPTDLPDWLPAISRTSSMMDEAKATINLPQDKIKNALFWFAQPTDIMGKFAYEHLLQGFIDKAVELFGKSNSWESYLCLSLLNLQLGSYVNALSCISQVIDNHCSDFCNAIVGQTYQCDEDSLRQQYLETLTLELDAYTLYDAVATSGVPQKMTDILRLLAVDVVSKSIEKSIATAKATNKDDANAQLAAGKKLMSDTKRLLTQLKKMSGGTSQISRICDKLAGQIFQCSVNYHNAIDNATDEPVNRTVIEDCLQLARYSQSIVVGKLTRDRIQEGIDILEKKESTLPPEGLEEYDSNIKTKILELLLDKGRTIDNAIQMMKDCAKDIVTIKERSSIHRAYYLEISTQVVNAALSCVIDDYNNVTGTLFSQLGNPLLHDTSIKSLKDILKKAWKATLMMDKFDVEDDFKNNRYMSNRKVLAEMYDKVFGTHQLKLISNDEFDLRTEDEVFKDCRTASNFKDYINRYPNGKHIEEARQRYQQLHIEEEKKRKEREERERKEQQKRKADDNAFISCTTISDFENYLNRYPNGLHATEAKNKIKEKKSTIANVLSVIIVLFIWLIIGLLADDGHTYWWEVFLVGAIGGWLLGVNVLAFSVINYIITKILNNED